MTAANYIAKYLASKGTTDAFGIPGGVILDLIYALDSQEGISPHLSYHEQSAGFAACGYAQASGKLGVAYATRGPGFTNLVTAIADAYYDSLPVLFITAHTTTPYPEDMRIMADQEMDTCSVVSKITKFASRIDSIEEIPSIMQKAYNEATSGRKGPVFLDIASGLLKKEILDIADNKISEVVNYEVVKSATDDIIRSIKNAERPLFLIGDGIHQYDKTSEFREFIETSKIPVVSSRYTHDICGASNYYFGYIGSHGIRTANFLLSKTDLIVSIGNRLHFPISSDSFVPLFDNARLIRIDIDKSEFNRSIANSTTYNIDLSLLLEEFTKQNTNYGNHANWIEVCNKIKTELRNEDTNDAVELISDILNTLHKDTIVVSDVGNNEFFVSRACVLAKVENHVLYSKSFGVLGNALGKSIGAYYSTRRPVVCFIGDQGLQLNIQELQYISQHHLPIAIVLLNNSSSAMIKDREVATKRPYMLHTTTGSGYGNPDFEYIAKGYGINYIKGIKDSFGDSISDLNEPIFVEVFVDQNLFLEPTLPKGCSIQNMFPFLDEKRFKKIDRL